MAELLPYEIKHALCAKPGMRTSSFSFGRETINSRLEDLLEYVFGNSNISFPDYSKGPFGLMNFSAFAENDKFLRLVQQNKNILSIMKEIKGIYNTKIISGHLSEPYFIEMHLNNLIKILDVELSSSEFYKRAEILKDNLLKDGKTYIPEELLYPNFYRGKRK
jgi:hypothetical protein